MRRRLWAEEEDQRNGTRRGGARGSEPDGRGQQQRKRRYQGNEDADMVDTYEVLARSSRGIVHTDGHAKQLVCSGAMQPPSQSAL